MRTKNQKTSDAHERDIQEFLGCIFGPQAVSVSPGSGNQAHRPADVRVRDRLLVECKTTEGDSISLKRSWLDKVRKQAFLGGLQHVLSVRLNNAKSQTFFVLDADYYAHLLRCEQTVERNDVQ